jgi:nucleotide-binding universal stress UspA family protein
MSSPPTAGPVVAGVDGSEASLAAAAWAARDAALRGTGLEVVTVWRPPVSNIQFAPNPEALRLWEEDRAREAAERAAADHPGLAVTARQVFGTPVPSLLEAAGQAAALVLGSRGLGRVGGLLLGSVGLAVLGRCGRPAVVVREDRSAAAPGADVVVGVDLDHRWAPLVDFAVAEAAARGAAVRVVHAFDLYRLFGYGAPALEPDTARSLRSEAETALRRRLRPWTGADGPEVRPEVLPAASAAGLVRAAEGAGLLVVGRRAAHHDGVPAGGRLGPVAHAALHHVRCPVAVVPHD